MLGGNSKNKKLSPEEQKQIANKKTAQQWNLIIDIENETVYRRDQHIVGAFRVQPLNIDLLSDNERRRIVDALAEALNGENEPLQIFCIGRPVDLTNYLDWLQNKLKNETDFIKKRLLKNFINVASITASSGETIERRFYIIVPKPDGEKNRADLLARLNDLRSKFAAASLDSCVCQDDELLDLYVLFSNPIQASFGKSIIEYQMPPVLNY